MHLTEQQKDRIRTEVRDYALGLFEAYSTRDDGVLEQVMDRFAEDIQGFGSGEHEIVSDLSGMREIIEGDFAATPDGLTANVRIHAIKPLAMDHAAVLLFADLDIATGESKVTMPLRYSMVVRRDEDGNWRMTQGHASIPDRDQAPDESVPLDAMRARAEKLEREVAERTAELEAANRDLQIEAALERVRGRSMAMRSSDELADLSLELVQQVQGLGVDTWFCAFNIYDDDPRGSIEWGSDGRGTIPHYRTPREGIFQRYFEAGQAGESLLINMIGEDECPGHYEWLCSLPGVGEILLEMKANGIDFPSRQIDHVAYNRYGYLIFITYEPAPESHDIFRRFSNVFEQTYTRFLDLKKAEDQTREAEISLAVEKVRARATAMRESTEIVDVADALRGQMQSLGLGTVNGCTIFLRAGGTRYRVSEMSRPDESDGAGLAFDIEFEPDELGEDAHVHEIMAAEDYTVLYFDSDRLLAAADLAALYDEEYAEGFRSMVRNGVVTEMWTSVVPLGEGTLCLDFADEPDAEVGVVMPRMAEAFDLAYRRFKDLQNAEAQAREAEINLAVEKVRARAMAMHRSEEMADVAVTMRNELQGLGVSGVSSSTVYTDQGEGRYRIWDMAEIQDVDDSLIHLDFVFHPEDAKGDLYFNDILSAGGYSTFHYHGDRLRNIADWLAAYDPVSAESMHRLLDDDDLPDLWISSYPVERGFLSVDTVESPSDELESILPKMAEAFDLAYRRFEDLQQAEAQTREAQIEAAMERVRSRAIGMQTSDELEAVADELRNQMGLLGQRELEVCGFHLYDVEGDTFEAWGAMRSPGDDGEVLQGSANFPREGVAIIEECIAGFESPEQEYLIVNEGEKALEFFGMLKEHAPEQFSVIEQSLASMRGDAPRAFWSFADFSGGSILMVTYSEPDSDSRELLRRCADVFDLGYRRFKDLRTAERQAREERIEAALERLRARTMAMHESAELQDVARTYADQLEELGMDIHGAMFLLQNPEDKAWTLWTGYSMSYPLEHVRGRTFEFPFQEVESDPSIDAWRRGETVSESFISPDDLPEWTEQFQIILDASGQSQEDWIRHNPDGYFRIDAYMKYGVVAAGGPRAFTPEEVQIQVRFAREFERTYRRFLDLKKAEAQTREAQIESALERIRSRALAMTQSDELLDIIFKIHNEFAGLGLPCEQFWQTKYTPEVYQKALTGAGGQKIAAIMELPRDFTDVPELGKWEEGDEPVGVFKFDADAAWTYIHHMIEKGDFRELDPEGITEEDIRANGGLTFVQARTSHGEIGYALWGETDPSEEAKDVLVRFAGAFDLAYRRFEDMRESEEAAREARIEAALERVRGQAMAMQKPDDIGSTCKALFDEVQILCPDIMRMGIGVAEGEHGLRPWLVGTDAEGNPCIYEGRLVLEGEREELDLIFAARREHKPHWFKESRDFLEWAKTIYTHAVDEAVIPVDMEKDQYFSAFPQQTGWVYVISHDPYEAEDEEGRIITRFGAVFDLAYKRYNDLKQAEEDYQALLDEKGRTEQALADLKATQKQLIEQEKLASLGSLTAGIAHEIKNPLNFVNNFAEVSEELMDELAAAVSGGDADEAAALLDELRQNARQIAKHGGRADSIVRSMMQHARGGASERETIDVNAFIEEYVDLAWHGMRARDHTFQCEVDRSFAEDAGSIDGQPQELGRVLLNLLNNAFYALSMEGAAAEPVVRVKTARSNGRVTITVADSGPGIPDDIREKIFEPFFTTKPTGEGTGLGLSLSYDIVTKGHGGEMSARNASSGGATFTIILPGEEA